MKTYTITKTATIYDIKNDFKKAGRDSFSIEALEIILDNEIELQGDNLDLDYIAIDCTYTEYETIEDLIDTYHYLLSNDMDEDEIIEEISHNVGYVYTLNGSFLVMD